MTKSSKEGLKVLPSGTVLQGLTSTNAVIATNTRRRDYDAVVIGAGFAGLTAARDLAKAGYSVAIVEARDRIGGRTYLAYDDGQKYEMGGTWIHWNQPFVWREVENYGLDIAETLGSTPETFSVLTASGLRTGSAEEFGPIADQAITNFCNVDGYNGAVAVPRPYNVTGESIAEYDQLSLADRMQELNLDEVSYTFVSSLVSMNAGNDPAVSALSEQLRWWALGNYSTFSMLERLGKYKLLNGTASLAVAMLKDSEADLFLNKPVVSVKKTGTLVEVTTVEGDVFRAATVISAIPLNVLKQISFEPPLRPGQERASSEGHVCKAVKFFAHVDRDLGAWIGFAAYPNPIIMAVSDRTVDGRSVIIGFGPQGGLDLKDISSVEVELGKLVPGIKIERLYTHDWNDDPYASGGWLWLRPGQTTECLADLQHLEAPVFFASGDWARGWRGFIDGAIEDGARNARAAIDYLRKLNADTPSLLHPRS